MQSIYEQEYCFLEYEYEKYLTEETFNRNLILNNIMVKSALIESADITAINEGAVDAVKGVIQKVVNLVKNLWNKFVERLSELVTSGNSYLEKYKDTIEKNAFKSHMLEDYYEYDTNNLFNKFTNTAVDGDFDEMMAAEDEAAVKKIFISKRLAGASVPADDSSVKEIIIDTFRGDAKTVDMVKLNKVTLYNYCANYSKTTLPELKKMVGAIDNASKTAETKVDQMIKGIEKIANSEKEEGQSDEDHALKQQSDFEDLKTKVAEESALFFNEMKVADKKGNAAPTDGNTNKQIGAAVNRTADTADIGDKQNSDEATAKLKKWQTNSKVFFTCLGDVLAGKMQIAADAYKQYMDVLKVHVRDYTGNEGKEEKADTK